MVHVMGADGEEVSYDIPFGSRVKVSNDDYIEAGDEITEGSVNPHDIMNIKGVEGARRYLLSEVQKTCIFYVVFCLFCHTLLKGGF